MTCSDPIQDNGNRVECSLPITQLTRDELWELLWRGTLVEHWLGTGSSLPAQSGQRLVLADQGCVRRVGVVRHVTPGKLLDASLTFAGAWLSDTAPCELHITIIDRAKGGIELRVAESGGDATDRCDEIEAYWRAVVARLSNLIQAVRKRRDEPRQAVIVIHGIGEQEPGATLRSLVASGVFGFTDEQERKDAENKTKEPKKYVKPDRSTGSFELRTIMFDPSPGHGQEQGTPFTDVYEMYWAHLMGGTTVSQVLDWCRRLLLRRGAPRPLKPIWVLIWSVIAVTVVGWGTYILGAWHPPRWLLAGGALVVVLGILWRLVGKGIVVNVIGDATRYLSPRPSNVASRQAIRQAGVDLLEALHENGRYDRVVVLGHSLGSVIAYDVVTYSWIRMHKIHYRPDRPAFGPLLDVDRGIAQGLTADAAQAVQYAAWQQVRRNTQPWLVTDLVTVGSPLTYANFLMGANESEFASAQRDRVLPTCPPQTEQKGAHKRCSYDFPYSTGDQRRAGRTFTVFDHGAPFAVTRWTNLFFRTSWGGFVGDIVGGPVGGQFGSWVCDIAVESPVKRFSHCWYWRRQEGNKDNHLESLQGALRLNTWRDLRDLAYQIPAYVVAERVVRSEGQ